jgi:hypothetical protein
MAAYSEGDLRLQFLSCREQWCACGAAAAAAAACRDAGAGGGAVAAVLMGCSRSHNCTQ